MRVLHIANIPSPYRVEYFNMLGKNCDLTVIFERGYSKSRDNSWKKYNFENFTGLVCTGVSIGDESSFSLKPVVEISRGNYDVIVIGNAISLTGLLEIWYLKKHNIKYWIETDGAFVPKEESKWKKMAKTFLLSGASGYLSTCENNDRYFERYGASPERIHRYPFSSVFEKDVLVSPTSSVRKIELREKLGITEPEMVITIGQFIPRKGLDVLLKSVKEFDSKVGFYFIGGKVQGDIEYPDNVHFVMFQDKIHLQEYYDAADLFAFPTREDIWGLVINEAMARGLPVISTDRCNAALEMVNGNNGTIVPSEDSKAMADAIEKLLLQKDRKYMSNEAINVARRYTIEKMVERHLEVWENGKN